MSDRASKALAEEESLKHTLLYQNVGMSLSPPSIIMHRGDARKNRRPKANSISLYRKRKLSKKFMKLISDLGNPVRIKFLPSLALSIAPRRIK
jgi:hypothetical protein